MKKSNLEVLFPLLNIGDASSVSAHSFTYEDGSYRLPDIEIKGNEKKVICNCCGESFYDEDALDVHTTIRIKQFEKYAENIYSK